MCILEYFLISSPMGTAFYVGQSHRVTYLNLNINQLVHLDLFNNGFKLLDYSFRS